MSTKTNTTPAAAVSAESVEQICKMGEYMKTSGEALQEFRTLADEIAEEQTKVAAVVPDLLTKLEAVGLLPSAEREQVTGMLNTHHGALKIASRIVELYHRRKQASAEAPRVGEGSDMGQGRETSRAVIPMGVALGSNDMRPSDRPLMQLAGLVD